MLKAVTVKEAVKEHFGGRPQGILKQFMRVSSSVFFHTLKSQINLLVF